MDQTRRFPCAGTLAVLTAPALVASVPVFLILAGWLSLSPTLGALGCGAAAAGSGAAASFAADRACRPPGAVPPKIARTALNRIAIGLLLAAIVLGLATVRFALDPGYPRSAIDPERVVRLSGTLAGDPTTAASGVTRTTLALHSVATREGWQAAAHGRVELAWRDARYLASGDLESSLGPRIVPLRGDRVEVSGVRLPPRAVEQVIWADAAAICVSEPNPTGTVRRTVREALYRRLARLSPRARALVTALLLGERNAVEAADLDAVRRAGASHALALSGMHLGILALALRALARALFGPRLGGLALWAALALYVWLVGWIPSLTRALVMLGCIEIGVVCDRQAPVPVLLARTLLVLVVFEPRIAREVGLWLSLAALAGLVCFSTALTDRLAPRGRLGRMCAAAPAASIAAIITTAPISLGVFGAFYPAGVIYAAPLSALVVVLMGLGLLFVGVASVPVAGTLCALILDRLVHLFHALAATSLAFPEIRLPPVFGDASPGLLSLAAVAAALPVVLLLRLRGTRTQSQLDW